MPVQKAVCEPGLSGYNPHRMHLLITSDTLTGVWDYTRELVSGLLTRGHRVTLVSFGEIPLPQQTAWMDTFGPDLDYRPTAFRLDWMEQEEDCFYESSNYLTGLVREIKPDLLHLNHPCYGSLPGEVPKIVAVHGDLVTWWHAVHGCEPSNSKWMRRYRELLSRGLAQASYLVAPSVWMLGTVRRHFAPPKFCRVIYPGRNPTLLNPYVTKDHTVLTIGRPWDAGKQTSLLTRQQQSLPVTVIDEGSRPSAQVPRIRTEFRVEKNDASVTLKGPQNETQLRMILSRSLIYAATSRYEPHAMDSLGAAFSRCAIVANDVPFHRELWGDAALYFKANDETDLSRKIRELASDRELCRSYGNAAYQRARECFTATRMVEDYLRLYRNFIIPGQAAA